MVVAVPDTRSSWGCAQQYGALDLFDPASKSELRGGGVSRAV
jgi:hypothetical protein